MKNIKVIHNEIWKPIYIKNMKTNYEVSNHGRIKNKKGKIIKFQLNKHGYLRVQLVINDKRYRRSVHRLVAKAFIENKLNKPEVNHKDGNKLNNNVYNLEWVTRSENMKHAYENNLHKIQSGEESSNSKYSKEFVDSICLLLEKGLSPKEILKELNLENNTKHKSLINNIKHKYTRKYETDNYNWNYEKNLLYKYDDEFIHTICNMIEKGKTPKEISNIVSVCEDSSKNYKKIKSLIDHLKEGARKDITSQYNLSKNLCIKYPDEVIHEMCKLISMKDYSLKEISKIIIQEFNYEEENFNKIYNIVKDVKRKKIRKNISEQYDF